MALAIVKRLPRQGSHAKRSLLSTCFLWETSLSSPTFSRAMTAVGASDVRQHAYQESIVQRADESPYSQPYQTHDSREVPPAVLMMSACSLVEVAESACSNVFELNMLLCCLRLLRGNLREGVVDVPLLLDPCTWLQYPRARASTTWYALPDVEHTSSAVENIKPPFLMSRDGKIKQIYCESPCLAD